MTTTADTPLTSPQFRPQIPLEELHAIFDSAPATAAQVQQRNWEREHRLHITRKQIEEASQPGRELDAEKQRILGNRQAAIKGLATEIEFAAPQRRDFCLRIVQHRERLQAELRAMAAEQHPLGILRRDNALDPATWARDRLLTAWRAAWQRMIAQCDEAALELPGLVPDALGARASSLRTAAGGLAELAAGIEIDDIRAEVARLQATLATELAELDERIATATWAQLQRLADSLPTTLEKRGARCKATKAKEPPRSAASGRSTAAPSAESSIKPGVPARTQ